MKYPTFADIPKIVIDQLSPTDCNTDAERALILKTVNAVLAAGIIPAEVKRITAQAEAMEAWQEEIGNTRVRHLEAMGLWTRIAVALDKIAGIES